MSSPPPTFVSVFSKDHSAWTDFLVSGTHRSMQSLIQSIQTDMQRLYPDLGAAVIEKEFARIRHEAEVDFANRSRLFADLLETKVFALPENPVLEAINPPSARKSPEVDEELREMMQKLANEKAKKGALEREVAKGSAMLARLKELQALRKEKAAIERQIEARDKELVQYSDLLGLKGEKSV